MTLVRWNPARQISPWRSMGEFTNEFFNMHRDLDRMFDRLRGDTTDDGQTSTWLPAVDIVEKENEFEVRVELPGMKKDDVKITLVDDVLTIRGEKKQQAETKEENYHRSERSYGMFQRSFTLPSSVKGEKIEATYVDGLLSLTLPKKEEAKSREIEVKVK